MLLELHNSIRRLLYERGRINPREVDIRFEAPIRERVEKLTRPTINIFLFDVQENRDRRQSDFQPTRTNGHFERRLLLRRFDLRYMVSILTTSSEDEYLLLWRVLATLVQHPQFPEELLSEELRQLETALATQVSQDDVGERLSSLWSGLGVSPHPALFYVVTVPLDISQAIEAPLVLTRTTRYSRLHGKGMTPDIRTQIGGIVRGGTGEPLANVKVALEGSAAIESATNAEGRFVLRGVPAGTVKLRVTQADGTQKVVTVDVPGSQSETASNGTPPYDIQLDAAAT